MALPEEIIKISGLNPFDQTLPFNQTEIIANINNTTFRTSLENLKELSELSVNTVLRSQTLNVASTIQTNIINTQSILVGTSLIVSETGTLQANVANISNLIVSNDIVGNLVGSITGNSGTTTALQIPRNFTLTGAINGSISSNLTDDVVINTLVNADTITNVQVASGAEILGTKIVPDFGNRNISTTGNLFISNIILGDSVGKATLNYSSTLSRTFTVPNVGVNADFVMTQGAQTLAGIKIFSSTPNFSSGQIDSPGASSHNHGSISISGSRSGYAGIAFPAANSVFMVRNEDGLSGIYRNNNTWLWYFDGSGTLSAGTVPWGRLSGIPGSLASTLNLTGNQTASGEKRFNNIFRVGFPSLGNNTSEGVELQPDGDQIISTRGSLYVRAIDATSSTRRAVLIFRDKGNTTRGSIQINNANTAYNTTSDYRLKNNAKLIPNILNQIKLLKPYSFQWFNGSSDYGFFAHELQSVYPQMVTGTFNGVDKDGQPDYQSVDYSKLTPVLTAAIQELINRVEKLENRFNNLFGKTFVLK